MRVVTGLVLQDAREIVGIVRQFEIEEDDARVVLVREDECARCATYGTNALVTLLRQHACETSANQTIGDYDQDAFALFGGQVGLRIATVMVPVPG